MTFYFWTAKIPSLNEYIRIERGSRHSAASAKKTATMIIAFSAIAQRTPLPEAKYDLIANWIVPNERHDADNIYFKIKFVLDGMVSGKVLKSDSRKHIRNISHTIRTHKKVKESVTLIFQLVEE